MLSSWLIDSSESNEFDHVEDLHEANLGIVPVAIGEFFNLFNFNLVITSINFNCVCFSAIFLT